MESASRCTQTLDHVTTVGRLLLPALPQRGLQHFADVTQVFESLFHVCQPVFDQALHGTTLRRCPGFVRQQGSRVVEREADGLSGSDELQFVERHSAVEPVIAGAAVFRFDQPDALVVANRGRRNACFLRQLTDGEAIL